ncbi:MAG: sulfatase-like hydrolase/transferase [Planctomycetaceae bacterium]|nr:sulfatase-like hydrolase/transferase [Planctomycetaceae bacterium]
MSARPHVLLITADHWPASLLGIAGHPVIQTPTLDQLARCGRRFPRAYSECPVCIPARRTLLTGTSPRVHGDRTFQVTLPMPDHLPTLPGLFRDAGYQAYAVGKVHVFPQRARVGFNDVILAEEGRPHWGVLDDYDIFLGDRGYAGRQFDHGMSNNEYSTRTWHLPDDTHVTNWTAQQMCRMIRRRDPTMPGFWYLSFTHPHPPLVPLEYYWNFYQQLDPPLPETGEWAQDESLLPYRLRLQRAGWHCSTEIEIRTALRAFYALCTQIDHQIRLVIGTLREEGLLDNTIILFTADHGDMLGTHGMWAKRLYYEGSAAVPMILVGTKGDERVGTQQVDHRPVGWQDILPTLLDLAGIEVPESVTGQSMVSAEPRATLYGECNEGETATRMLHEGRYKLIYYAAGNVLQLFDLEDDPTELLDLSTSADHTDVRNRLVAALKAELYGSDLTWLKEGELVGLPEPDFLPEPARDLSIQRGTHWPLPPVVPPEEKSTKIQ